MGFAGEVAILLEAKIPPCVCGMGEKIIQGIVDDDSLDFPIASPTGDRRAPRLDDSGRGSSLHRGCLSVSTATPSRRRGG